MSLAYRGSSMKYTQSSLPAIFNYGIFWPTVKDFSSNLNEELPNLQGDAPR